MPRKALTPSPLIPTARAAIAENRLERREGPGGPYNLFDGPGIAVPTAREHEAECRRRRRSSAHSRARWRRAGASPSEGSRSGHRAGQGPPAAVNALTGRHLEQLRGRPPSSTLPHDREEYRLDRPPRSPGNGVPGGRGRVVEDSRGNAQGRPHATPPGGSDRASQDSGIQECAREPRTLGTSRR